MLTSKEKRVSSVDLEILMAVTERMARGNIRHATMIDTGLMGAERRDYKIMRDSVETVARVDAHHRLMAGAGLTLSEYRKTFP